MVMNAAQDVVNGDHLLFVLFQLFQALDSLCSCHRYWVVWQNYFLAFTNDIHICQNGFVVKVSSFSLTSHNLLSYFTRQTPMACTPIKSG
jgi:hypothetical protein